MIRGFQTVRIVQWRSAAGRLRWASLPDKQATKKLQPVPPELDIVWTVLTNCVKVLQDPCPRLSHRSFQMYPLYINACPWSVVSRWSQHISYSSWCFHGVFLHVLTCGNLRNLRLLQPIQLHQLWPPMFEPNAELCPWVPAIICHPYQVSVKCKVWRYFAAKHLQGKHSLCCWVRRDFSLCLTR